MVSVTSQFVNSDPIESIPDPTTIRQMIADNVRRSEMLRALLRISTRKASLSSSGQCGNRTHMPEPAATSAN